MLYQNVIALPGIPSYCTETVTLSCASLDAFGAVPLQYPCWVALPLKTLRSLVLSASGEIVGKDKTHRPRSYAASVLLTMNAVSLVSATS
jgi:hypothetical protein